MNEVSPTTLLREHGPLDQTRGGGLRWGERALRDAVERWMRLRWPAARIVHELVLNRGDIRLDMAAVLPDELVIVEVKSGTDNFSRAIHQTGMATLCGTEAWLIGDRKHKADGGSLRYLLPSLGLAYGRQTGPTIYDQAAPREIEEELPATRREPHGEALLSLLWVAELRDEAHRHGVPCTAKSTHRHLVTALAERLSAAERIRAVCRQLRSRDALWRADPPVKEDNPRE